MAVIWSVNPAVRLRPIPEQECCLFYVPRTATAQRSAPVLTGLNATSWYVWTLCTGRTFAAIARDYLAALGPAGGPAASQSALEGAFIQLEALGLILRSDTATDHPH